MWPWQAAGSAAATGGVSRWLVLRVLEGVVADRIGGAAYALRITELQPEGAASIIDTDLEVDVLPSVEYEEAMRAEAEALRARVGEPGAAGELSDEQLQALQALGYLR